MWIGWMRVRVLSITQVAKGKWVAKFANKGKLLRWIGKLSEQSASCWGMMDVIMTDKRKLLRNYCKLI